MSTLKIGDKVILHSVEIPHLDVDKEDTFLVVTVNEIKKVPGIFGNKKDYEGYKGVDKNDNEWAIHWEHYPDDAMNPIHMWTCHTNTINVNAHHIMYDVEDVNKFQRIEKCPEWINLSINRVVDGIHDFCNLPTIMEYCEKHQCIYYKRNGCFNCEYNIKEIPTKRTMAKGW